MAGICVGHVTHYYGDLHVAVLALEDALQVGDWLHLLGRTTDFAQPVLSLQVNHQPVTQAGPGQLVALMVNDRVHVNDLAYRITSDEVREIEDGRVPDRSW